MIRCPHCHSIRVRVIGGAPAANYYRRHRKCKACSKNFFTREFLEADTGHDAEAIRLASSFVSKALILLQGRKIRTKPRKKKSIDQ